MDRREECFGGCGGSGTLRRQLLAEPDGSELPPASRFLSLFLYRLIAGNPPYALFRHFVEQC